MRARKIESLLAWFRRKHAEVVKLGTFAWYNIHKELTIDEIDKINNFCKKRKEICFCVILSGINELRPQRTCGSIPEWFRNNTQFRNIEHTTNSFVFIDYKPPLDDLSLYDFETEDEHKNNLFENVKELAKQAECDYRIFEYNRQ